MSTATLVVLLAILAVIDISAILGGYFPSDNYFYWLNDLNSGVIPLFKEDLGVFFNRDIEVLRNLIVAMVFFSASLTISGLLGLSHFLKRRFVASQWPLALWKLSTIVLGFRLLMVTWIVQKFHKSLLKDILIELEEIDDKDIDNYSYSLAELYRNGTIGLIPASGGGTRLLGLLTVLMALALSVEMVDCSGTGKKKAKESGSLSRSAVSTRSSSAASASSASAAAADRPLSLDLRSLHGIADVAIKVVKSPLKVCHQNFKHISLDFDGIMSDSDFPCAFFGNTLIYMSENWNAPLLEINRVKNLMNLEGKLQVIGGLLQKELFDSANSLSWVSDSGSITNYVLVVSSSFVHLSYLISRLRNTPKCSKETSLKIRSIVKKHLEVLAQFCSDIKAHSGRHGISHLEKPEIETAIYLRNLISLRVEPDLSGISDEMLEIFINFLFESFAEARCEEMTQIFIEKTRSDFWIPLPIDYFRNRMIYDNKELLMGFISSWTIKVFDSQIFDSRHLVTLGLLLQQELICYQVLKPVMNLALANGHKSQYKLNGDMVKFLTLTASTPWLLPDDPESVRLIGNFSNPQIDFQRSKLSESEKVTVTETIWKFFVNPADFSNMKKEDYDNLCALISRLDKVFPGIHENLWSLFGDSETEGNGLKFAKELKIKIETFKTAETWTWPEKLQFIRSEFTSEKTFEDLRMNSDLLYFSVGLLTEILQQGVEELSVATEQGIPHIFETEIKVILRSSVEFMDLFLRKYATKAVIDYWYSKYDYHPTGLYDVLFDIWVSDDASRLHGTTEFLIYDNLTKLVDNNLNFARNFMMMQVSKSLKHRFPALSATATTPKCLIESGEADRLNFELFQSYLQVAISSQPALLSDFFFCSLAGKLAREEISFESARNLFEQLESERNLGNVSFDMEIEGFVDFWDPSVMITVLQKRTEDAQVIADTFKVYMRLIGESQDISISTCLLRNLACFMGFVREICAEIIPEISALTLPSEFIDSLVLGPQADESYFSDATLNLFQIFHISIGNEGISGQTAKAIFVKLVEISRRFLEYPVIAESDALVDFVYAFNCAFLAIIRVPGLAIPDETKTVIQFYDFFRKIKNLIPEPYENLINGLVSKPVTLVSLYGKMISNHEAIPASAFSWPVQMDRNFVSKIQSNYIAMLGEDFSRLDQIYLGPIIEWIKREQIGFEMVLKLLKLLTPDVPFGKFLNFIPIVTEVLKCPSYTEKQKLEALETAFSQDNDEFIRTLSNLRNTISHDGFIELCLVQESRAFLKFMEKCKSEIWYEGLRLELKRAANRSLLGPTSNSSNLTTKAEAFRFDIIDLVSAGSPNYWKRRSIVYEINEFMSKDSDILPILRDGGLISKPLELIHIYLASLLWEIVDGSGCFFKVIPEPESFLEMLRVHSIIFKQSPRRKALLGWILGSINSPTLRQSVLNLIPQLITIDNFVLTSGSINKIAQWHESKPFEQASTIQNFISTVAERVFEILKTSPAGSDAPVFDQMLTVLCEMYGSDSGSFILGHAWIHDEIIDEIINLSFSVGHAAIMKNSSKLMVYLKFYIESCKTNYSWMNRVINLLERNVELYIKNRMEWIIIWKHLSQILPFEFMNISLKIYLNLGSVKLSQWEPLLEYISPANLPAKVLVNVVHEIVSKDDFQFESLNVLHLIPDELEFEDFASFEQVDCVLKCIVKSIKYLVGKEETIGGSVGNEGKIPLELTTDLLEKLFVLLDLDSRTGRARAWNWSRIFNILRYSKDIEGTEHVFLDGLLETYPKLMERTLKTEDAILEFSFKIGQFINKASYERFDELVEKTVGLYDKITSTRSIEVDFRHNELFLNLKAHVHRIRASSPSFKVSEEEFHQVLGLVEKFNAVALGILPTQRQDEYAQLTLLHCFSFMEVVYINGFLDSAALKLFANQVTQVIAAVINSGNLITLSKTMRMKDIEAYVQIVTEHVELHDECADILDNLMKISASHVADEFFEQISDKKFRKDVCFISESIISEYKSVVKNGFAYVTERDWPLFYLDGLIEGPAAAHIDPKHFDAISRLLLQFDDLDSTDFPVLLEKLSELVIKRGSVLEHVFKFIDNLLESEYFKKEVELDDLYDNFFTDELVNKLMTVPASQTAFLNYLKRLKKKSETAFDKWFGSELKMETKARLAASLKADALSNTMTLHTRIAEAMIAALAPIEEENQLTGVLQRFKKLEIKSVSLEVLSRLSETFITKLFGLRESIPDSSAILREAVKFILSFQLEATEELITLALKAFDEEIFMIFAGRSAGREGLVGSLSLFSSKINVAILRGIKKQLVKYDLWDNVDLLEDAASNSEANQTIEFLQMTKLSLEAKLNILNSARIGTSSDKITLLLNYFKSLLGNQSPNLEVILRALLENPSLMSQFLLPNCGRNRQVILGLLKKHLKSQMAKDFIGSCGNKIGRLVLKIHFRASSSAVPMIDDVFLETFELVGFFDSLTTDALSNTSDSSTARTLLIIKAFKLAEEIERLTEASVNPNSLAQLTVNLAALLWSKQHLMPGPISVYSVYKMMRQLAARRRERVLITRWLLFSSKTPRHENFDAFLQAQLHSREIDWELHDELVGKLRGDFPRIQALMHDFEASYRK